MSGQSRQFLWITPLCDHLQTVLHLTMLGGSARESPLFRHSTPVADFPYQGGRKPVDPTTQDLIQKLMARNDSLERRAAELERERGRAAAAPTSGTAATPGPTAVAGPHDHDQAAALQIENQETGQPALKINGFGDVDFTASNLRGANGGFEPATPLGAHGGFALGQTTVHLISAFPQSEFLLRNHFYCPE